MVDVAGSGTGVAKEIATGSPRKRNANKYVSLQRERMPVFFQKFKDHAKALMHHITSINHLANAILLLTVVV